MEAGKAVKPVKINKPKVQASSGVDEAKPAAAQPSTPKKAVAKKPPVASSVSPIKKPKEDGATTKIIKKAENQTAKSQNEEAKTKKVKKKVKIAEAPTKPTEKAEGEVSKPGVKIKKVHKKTKKAESAVEKTEDGEAKAQKPKKKLKKPETEKAPEIKVKQKDPAVKEDPKPSGEAEQTLAISDPDVNDPADDYTHEEVEGRKCCFCFPCVRIVPALSEAKLKPWCCLVPCLRVKSELQVKYY